MRKHRPNIESKESVHSFRDDEFAGIYNINQADDQLVQLYDNLAAYSDYLMRLTDHQDGKITKSSDSNKLFNRGNTAAMQLIKKSNDIKGKF